MKKRLISLIVAVVMLFSMLCPAAYADDETVSFDTCTHEWETPLRSGYSITIPGSDVSFSVKTEQCKKCKWYKHVATIFIAEFTYYSPLNVDANGLVPTELATYWANVWYNNFGKNATATKFTPGGGSTSGGGVGRPKGYSVDGKAYVDSNGKSLLWAEPFGLTGSFGWYTEGSFSKDAPGNLCAGASGSGTSFIQLGSSASTADRAAPVYYFTAPVSGLYYIGVDGSPYDLGSFNSFYNNTWNRTDYEFTYTDTFHRSISLNKGESAYLTFNYNAAYCSGNAYKYFLNNIPIFIEPLGDSGVTNQNNITINNNTWNGNIYVDNSNNLTYIYPQYTTVNEKNETVTNISSTPIIYNNETYQYYTYDQTTKNYYYITYPNQPTPPPTATPSPTPDPDTEHPVRDMYYRWILTERRSTDDGGYNAIQVSELEFYDKDKNLISWPSDVSIKSSLDTSWNEPITNLVDNKINNKWGCNRWGSGKTGKCVIDIYAPNMQIPSYYGYVTGSDMPARDPVSWKLYYSFNGLKYYEASTMEQATNIPTGRNAKTEKWPFNYQSPTPSPSPTPAPTEKPGGSISTPETGKPGGDGGDTTGILAVLVEIRDNMIQGFLDIKAAFVAGFAELSANFTLAIENLNVNIQNIFNKKFPDQSTPETALPSPTPSPSPAPTDPPSPSPAPDPGKPDSGDKTNNFWTIIFPNGGGSEDGKKGIFWALVSLILALIAFFANLAVGVGYLFPFLPDGVVMTINTCLIVIFLFTIIKFIMRSK
ncbi:hypothetical protein [Gemmiger sp.]